MVKFKTWEDFHKFLKKYAKCSCLNCIGFMGDEYAKQFICMRTLSPVRFDMLHICVEWKNKDGKTLKDFENKGNWNFSDRVAIKLEELGEVTFEEIEKVIEDESE